MAVTHFGYGDAVPDRTTAQYQTTLLDSDDNPIADAAISDILATLVRVSDGAVINSRDAQSVHNANGGTMHSTSGLFTLQFDEADTAADTGGDRFQRRRLTLDVTLVAGGRQTHDVQFFVEDLLAITA